MPKLKQKLSFNQIQELEIFIKNKDHSVKEIKRSQAILMVDNKLSLLLITQFTGYSKSQAFELRNKYLSKGLESIKDPLRKNPKLLLTRKQRDKVTNILQTKSPKDFGYDSGFWTTGILTHYIQREYKAKYKSRTSIYIIFKESKFTFHKPGRVYEKRDEEEVKEWERKTKPIIKKALEDKNTIILTEDEMILSTQTTFQKIWLPKGEYPKIEVSNTKKNRSVYGFLNIKTGKEHAFKTEWQNMHITTDILKKIRKIYPNEKLLIIWDGAGWHRGSVTQEFIKEDKNIETIYFPRYSPDQNPQEHVWKQGRDKVTHNKFIENIDTATDEFVAYLNTNKFPYKLLGFNSDFGV